MREVNPGTWPSEVCEELASPTEMTRPQRVFEDGYRERTWPVNLERSDEGRYVEPDVQWAWVEFQRGWKGGEVQGTENENHRMQTWCSIWFCVAVVLLFALGIAKGWWS